jgi:hypothetical protein
MTQSPCFSDQATFEALVWTRNLYASMQHELTMIADDFT